MTEIGATEKKHDARDVDRQLRVARRLSERLHVREAYGVPVLVLTTGVFPSLRRENTKSGVDGKNKDQQQSLADLHLGNEELRLLEQAAEFVYQNGIRTQMEADGGDASEDSQSLMKEYAAVRIYKRLKKMIQTGNEGEFVNFWRWHQKGKRQSADKAGPNKYKELGYGIVLLNTSEMDVKQILGRMLHTYPYQVAETGLSYQDLYLAVLEHELAHAAGAGESQADAMAAAQIIRATGERFIPAQLADIRALMCVRDYLVHVVRSEVEGILPGASAANPRVKGQLGRSRENIARYGWAPVEALDAQILNDENDGQTANDDADIAAMRWVRHKSHHGLLYKIAKKCLEISADSQNEDAMRLRRAALLHGRINYRRLERQLQIIESNGEEGLRREFNSLTVKESAEMLRLIRRIRKAIDTLIMPSPDMQPRLETRKKKSPLPPMRSVFL